MIHSCILHLRQLLYGFAKFTDVELDIVLITLFTAVDLHEVVEGLNSLSIC